VGVTFRAMLPFIAAVGCSVVHGPLPCGLDRSCPDGFRCREVREGELLCLEACSRYMWSRWTCDSGEACLYIEPLDPSDRPVGFVCWPGGPRWLGEACAADEECGYALACNRFGVCSEACPSVAVACSTPGELCDDGACVVPLPWGTPCTRRDDCSAGDYCSGPALFSCQGRCFSEECRDGRVCSTQADCMSEPAAIDLCERTAEGSTGCASGEVCALTQTGVRRCMPACERDVSSDCGGGLCLPDPEDPERGVCWAGGTAEHGEPCGDAYDCVPGYGCSAVVRTCQRTCATGCLLHQECRDLVCEPEGTST
jgi:hypothetical protein